MSLSPHFNFKKTSIILASIIFLVGAIALLPKDNTATSRITTTVQRGDVQNVVSVSGFVEAKSTAKLAFPLTGTVTDVFISEGDTVAKDDLLATLGSAKLVAQRNDAVALLQKANATRNSLLAGPTDSARAVTDTTVESAKQALSKTVGTETQKVKNSLSTLLSNNLQAYTTNSSEAATAPTITGTYTCEKQGTYAIEIYTSGASSGYSYTLTGLESSSGNVTTKQPASLGICGLLIQFTEGDSYGLSDWTVEIPNTKSATYTTYENAYQLALKQKEQNILTAKNALALSQKNQVNANATPSAPELQQANAVVYSAQARIANIDAQIADLSIVAPFDGIVTTVDIQPGETGTTKPVITLLAQNAYELKARVPEIDVIKVTQGQSVKVVFDAQTEQTLVGTVSFASPLATIIDGVAYFETTILLDQTPDWIRSGLNADIDIIVSSSTDVLRIPKRYLIKGMRNDTYTTLVLIDNNTKETPVTVLERTNDGFATIEGLTEGDVIVAP